MSEPLVRYDKPLDGVASITLNRPEALNAINMAMRDELWTFIQASQLDPEVRVLVFRGEGARAFSAGADISEFGTAPSLHESREARRLRDLWALLEDLPIPTIAALHGFCFGAGIELPLYCDLRIAAENTRIALPEVTLGYIPSAGGTQLMPRIAPPGAARGLILSGAPIVARQAQSWGIVHRIVAADELDATVFEVARRLADAEPAVAAAVKRSIRRGFDLPMSAAIRQDALTARRLANTMSDR
ncbi:MAG: enoyl-CoA hydratase/isomerase family protein [Chloroflexi bacterium]|nr:enoyl-CoA hydratase/isomerase family protein [Chloroflexota bacterium]MYF80832.1 enoyl-CoA hydratase/isomerase family protein [Chloroflexota bacterium]MYI05442.1 enoyl-CoA hydratase/isomerase family protein [Chloroflexota bacterium]